ncbi:unnamed protein product [Prunus armeniaca]|uniref:Aminotransferase-like plant mobile domain-containing protein n=1 Tax=Prunus armeniaca TaxID=36596 RepID=A0A6J5X887_PRUAR|nr:unnamed protein product [Prunus armeniaca]
MESPPETMVEEREEHMVSPTGGNPFRKKAYFLKPTLPSCTDEFELPRCFSSSLPTHFKPKSWHLNVEFYGWRSSQENWKTWVYQMAPVHHEKWKEAGIYEAIISSTYEIRKVANLGDGFAEKWCSETNTFIFPWGEATITLEDVMVLGGFSALGASVLSPLQSKQMKEVGEKLIEGQKEIYSSGKKAVTKNLWLKKFMNSGNEFEHEAFLAFWLSRYVLVGSRNSIQNSVFSVAIHLARGTRIALGPAVLASIYKDLSLLKKAIVGSKELDFTLKLKSPFHLVQVWAWERFSELKPENPNPINSSEPRMARWDKVNGVRVENLRRVLDSARENFLWRPYALVTDNWHIPKYYPQEEIELVGLYTIDIEHYLPHRVAMQFGYDQDLPCSVTRANRNLDTAWDYNKEIKNVKLYLPSRLVEADVTTKYLKWWKQSVSGLEDAREAAVPGKKGTKSLKCLLPRANHPSVPPGFPPKRKRMAAEDPIDEDELTVSQLLKFRKKHENFGIIQGSDSEKLSSQAQHFASPIAQKSYVNTMKSDENIVNLVGDECVGSSSLFQKRQLELGARFERLATMVDELKARRLGNKV